MHAHYSLHTHTHTHTPYTSHNMQEVPTGTILQPNLQRRKSVTKLKSGDFTDPRTTNYCLTTQEQDSQGELETKLFKVVVEEVEAVLKERKEA